MKRRKRHSPEQIIRKLQEADTMLAADKSIGQVCQAVTVYDLDTACLIRDLSRPRLDSYDQNMRSNWLPAPKDGDFSLYIRAYWPKAAITDGSWTLPAVVKSQ